LPASSVTAEETEATMLCAELERLEAQFDDILTALENPSLTEEEKRSLQQAYSRLSHTIHDHQQSGHNGNPCFEE
jgi:hypothetical protein